MKKIFFFVCFLVSYLYANPLRSETSIPTGIKIYFTDPPYSSGNIEKEFINFIEQANNTQIYAAFYRIDLTTITYTFNQALNRGCTVYVICDDPQDSDSLYWQLKVSSKTLGNKSGLMHNKFCVIKDSAVWTGSWNPTGNDTTKNNNNAILIRSSWLAKVYEDEFFRIFNSSGGVTKSTTSPSGEEETVNGMKIKVFFAPYQQNTIKQAILDELSQAKKAIYFCLYDFTENDIGDKLVELIGEGIKVYGIFDLEQAEYYSEYTKLFNAGAQVVVDVNPYSLHHKFAIIDPFTDSAKLITGSANWSSNANEKNDENLLIIYSPEVAEVYYQEFLKLWRQSSGATDTGQKAIENLTLYPSPAENHLNICFDLGNNVKDVEITIYSLVGEKVRTVIFPDFTAGIRNKKKIFLTNDESENLASGIYFLKVEVETTDGTFYQVKKFALLR